MSHARLLVVDDDRSISTAVASLLSAHGFEVDTADDGASALALIDEQDYDLAVMDYQMPEMNGVELFREARQRQPDLVGVFLTAYTTLDTVFPAVDAGVERVLSKPVNAAELIPVVEQLLAEKH